MKKINNWINNKINSKVNPLFKLFLTGIKGQMQIKYAKPYRYYIRIISLMGTIAYGYYFLKFRERQIDKVGYNILIPDYIYRVR